MHALHRFCTWLSGRECIHGVRGDSNEHKVRSSGGEESLPALTWEAFYLKGSINPSRPIPGSFGFYLSGPSTFSSKLESGVMHVVLSYHMMLQHDLEWVKDGKLPGIFTEWVYIGIMISFEYVQSKGLGELYTYLSPMPANRERLLTVPSSLEENSNCSFFVSQDAYIAVGKWVSLSFHVKLNSKSVINITGLMLCDLEHVCISKCSLVVIKTTGHPQKINQHGAQPSSGFLWN
ncbi:hypothetical protein DFH08DRAFT_799207 [Mycena albidolilacea]|uniref:Polysaccharide lyase 14 domain-containing protein n=1 Tax=Mycena albidolilacea TaxID=1033008 RepID=A0AAD7AQ89_9AGAR|nr:hypothetical protein DFH08DRAFT_799207 [Mycena albidolilacea]